MTHKKSPKVVNLGIVTTLLKKESESVEGADKEKEPPKKLDENTREKGEFLNSNSNIDISSLHFPQRAKQLQLDTQFQNFFRFLRSYKYTSCLQKL